MKKLLLSTIVLLAFSCALIIFQLSCKKAAEASTTNNTNNNTTTTTTQQNKLIVAKDISVSDDHNEYMAFELWTTNYDGSNPQKINITLPTNTVIYQDAVRLSPDGKLLFFQTNKLANQTINNTTKLMGSSVYTNYSCNLDGSNPQPLNINLGSGYTFYTIQVAY